MRDVERISIELARFGCLVILNTVYDPFAGNTEVAAEHGAMGRSWSRSTGS